MRLATAQQPQLNFCRGVAAPAAVRPRRRRAVVAAAAGVDAAAGPLKQALRRQAGGSYGHDLIPEARAAVEATAAALAALTPAEAAPAEQPLAGTSWRLLYTNAVGNSSGMFGPLLADSTQVFHGAAAEPRGATHYVNDSRLGPLTLALAGRCWPASRERIQLQFDELRVSLFGRRLLTRPLGAMAAHWRAVYGDADTRVFFTNKGSLFVLVRDERAGGGGGGGGGA